MIKVEKVFIRGKEFKKTYSDKNKIIKKVGTEEEYEEAIDLPTSNYEYVETNKEIEEETNEE